MEPSGPQSLGSEMMLGSLQAILIIIILCLLSFFMASDTGFPFIIMIAFSSLKLHLRKKEATGRKRVNKHRL